MRASSSMNSADPRDPRPRTTWTRPTVRRRAGNLCLRAAGRLLGRHPIVLEYAPPRFDRERWGWGAPPNAALYELIAAGMDRYAGVLELIDDHATDIARIAASTPAAAAGREPSWNQHWFTGLDAAALYALIRARRPARYHEVGSGHSTLFAARAIRDGQLPTHILSVDPQPRAEVDLVCDEVVRAPLEGADARRVAALDAGDVLLVDSSHYALKGSDVVALFLDVLPSLPPGVLVGIHDAFLPDDYPWWLSRWYAEQYVLAAWLLGAGGRVELVFATHFCATEPVLRARADAVWERRGLPGIAYGSTLWFET